MPFDALISKTIGSLVNGISQQPPAIRLKSQAEEQENCLSDVVGGVSRRPPTKHVAGDVGSGLPSTKPTGGIKLFPIDRGSGEQFIGILQDGDVNVFDLSGFEKTVTDAAAGTPGSYTYLDFDAATYTAEEAFATVTVADYTFIVNKTKTVAMSGNSGSSSTVTRLNDHEFLLWVLAPPKNTTITLDIAGTQTSGATGAGFSSSAAVTTLMTNLTGAATGTDVTGTLAGFTNWKFTRTGATSNWIYGYQFQAALETVQVFDDYGDTVGKYAATSTAGEDASTQKFSDLPSNGKDGFIVKISGADGNTGDDYYVTYDAGESVWRETAKPGLDNEFDPDTMPHVLVWNGTSFTFQPGTWDNRTKGDAESAPEPTFVGREIKDIVLHKSRLIVCADENVMGTEANEYFNFWPTTVTTVVASDPFDVSAGGNQVNLLEYMVPYQRNLLLFSPTGGTQQELVGSDVEALTVENARIEERTAYAMVNLKPTSVGRNVYFATERNQWTGLHEFSYDGLDRPFAEDVSGHVPSYVPANVDWISGSRAENVVLLHSSDDLDSVYVYRFWYIGDQKVQSSWSRWNFDPDCEVTGALWFDSTCYLGIFRDGGLSLEKMDFRETESLDNDGVGIGRLIHLDKQWLGQGQYVSGSNTTRWQVNYDARDIGSSATWGNKIYAVKVPGALLVNWPAEEMGEIIELTLNVAATGTIYIHFDGDVSGGMLIWGWNYESKYTASEVVLEEGSDERPRPIISGSTMLKRWTVLFRETTDFFGRVTFRDDDDMGYAYEFSTLDTGTTLANVLPEDGEFSFPVGTRSEHGKVSITSQSPGQFTLTAMEWEGRVFQRASRG